MQCRTCRCKDILEKQLFSIRCANIHSMYIQERNDCVKIIIAVAAILMLCACGQSETAEVPERAVMENTAESPDLYSISNKGSGWGFKKNEGRKPDIPAETTEMMTKYDTFYMDLSERKVMYLTFDEGYENGYTGQILDTLKKCKVPAAFFITGDYFDREQELVRRMYDEGHIIGNHTEHHPNLHKLENPEKMQEELKILDDKYFAAFGEHMKYMRPPEGEYSERVLAAAQAAGYKTALWSFAYKDWQRGVENGSQYAYNAVTPYFHSGAVILLHAVSKDNADALESIINCAREQGYEFKSLDYIE